MWKLPAAKFAYFFPPEAHFHFLAFIPSIKWRETRPARWPHASLRFFDSVKNVMKCKWWNLCVIFVSCNTYISASMRVAAEKKAHQRRAAVAVAGRWSHFCLMWVDLQSLMWENITGINTEKLLGEEQMAQWTDCICVTARKTRRLGNVSEGGKIKFRLEILKSHTLEMLSITCDGLIFCFLSFGYITDIN